jgi:hypothetical protein
MPHQPHNPIELTVVLRRAFLMAIVLVLIYSAYTIIYSLILCQSSGLLNISSSDTSAGLSVGQNNHQSVNVGMGSASVRLKPGSYQVTASDNGYQTVGNVSVTKKHVTYSNLYLVASSLQSNSNNIFNDLPVIGANSIYEISVDKQAVNDGNASGIVIGAPNPQGYQYALQWIRQQGYDPADYKITFQTITLTNSHPYAD